ncbi:uncharacterized protein BHQ10_006628 [Talaromyces amestolkiae]|uniref:Major facilitator superfamily (MFS) profile domain-containing protein n=1 Tax=Talaromyces amestolkiae TaxID=1196081 RepID=A0A364L493_TALAM|nr:uncharacterized protein BHQ10_006628 [Talaromyces amestolkiae]RAO70616.1 hypothetical protein BHQ10_006628 [Talaromyces amestolkiae]
MSNKQDATSLQNQENILPKTRLLIVISCISLVLFTAFIDQNGVSVALPSIAADLNAEDTIPWAGTSSLIANTVFSVLYGRLSDIFGRKSVLLTACVILAVADLLCGFAQNAPMLYFFRAMAGLAGGGITNLAMIFVSDVVTLEERGKYQGIIGACLGVANIVGPFMAAGFIQAPVGWRGFFWTLTPIVASGGAVCWFVLPASKVTGGFREKLSKIDVWGCLTSSAGIVLLLIPISGGGLYFQWNSAMVISMLVIGSCALVAFVIIEWKVARIPMMPMNIFKNQSIVALLLQSFLLGWVYQSYLYYLPQYYQNIRGYSVIVSAALSIPLVFMQSVGSVVSGQYISRRHHYGVILWSGFASWTVGCGLSILFDQDTNPGVCVVALLLIGIGVGFVFQPTLVALQAHSPKSQRAVIISSRNFFRCAGGACGLAISATILQSGLRSHLPADLKYVASSIYNLPTFDDSETTVVILSAYMKATKYLYITNTVVIGVCLCACVSIKDRGLGRNDEPAKKETSTPDAITVTESGSEIMPAIDQTAVEVTKIGRGDIEKGGTISDLERDDNHNHR